MKEKALVIGFDEFGAPECSWSKAKSRKKRFYLFFIFLVATVDFIALIVNLAHPPYSTVDLIEIVAEIIVLAILVPKLLGLGPGIRRLKADQYTLKMVSGIAYRKEVALKKLEKIGISEKSMGNRKLTLHYKNGRKEITGFQMFLPYMEDRRRIATWLDEVNERIKTTH